ncbi:hypothetical protein FOZ61_001816 [Perkinsus olseni]|uniref:Uncharacterized protein n=1 Tax=Perkinsus olseni TaxID=32597 RepID=A0A7J6LVK3_PEROL|nr:hypothetical protein FOZ61_001816 [Perkinsus olseni]
MIIVPTWNADASKEEVLTLLMAGAESYTAEGEDQPSEELSYSVSFFFRYRQLAQDFGKKLADMIDVWSRARSQPGVEALELFIREEWGKIDEQFTFEEDEVQIHVRCLIVCLCVAEIIAAALLLVIGDEKHNGLEPLRTMLTGVFLDAIIPEKLLPKEARRVMRTLRRQANKDLLESAYSPVGVLWQGFRGILRDNYVDDDPLKEAPQPVTSNGQDSHVKWSIPAPRESDVSVSHVRRHGSHLNDPSGSPSSRSLIFEDSQV